MQVFYVSVMKLPNVTGTRSVPVSYPCGFEGLDLECNNGCYIGTGMIYIKNKERKKERST
jgi:hypothetical protein